MEVYGVKCTTDDVLNLDSSTNDKFSRHLIFNLQNAAFKDNIHVGAFCVAQSCLFVNVCVHLSESRVMSPAGLQEGLPMQFFNQC